MTALAPIDDAEARFAHLVASSTPCRRAETSWQSSAELTPERWAACATAWSELLSRRPDQALRFSQLYAALTAPRP